MISVNGHTDSGLSELDGIIKLQPATTTVRQPGCHRDGPGRASSRLPLERCDSARAGGGALPVIMSIICDL